MFPLADSCNHLHTMCRLMWDTLWCSSLVSQHQTWIWSWSQQYSSNTEQWYVCCSSQHYVKTKTTKKALLNSTVRCLVHGEPSQGSYLPATSPGPSPCRSFSSNPLVQWAGCYYVLDTWILLSRRALEVDILYTVWAPQQSPKTRLFIITLDWCIPVCVWVSFVLE